MKCLSPVEYSRKYGKSLSTVYRQLWVGKLQAERVDGKWLIDPNAIPAKRPVTRG